ncbi:hypothetical protein ACK6S7_17125 [Proteus mirabilis]|uniref:hypothetical protein n=1 Tax=Proteus mirabilis TaxID=584 RepID=UPI0039B3C05A
MVFSIVKTYYLSRSGKDDGYGLVRYDAIRINDEKFLIKALYGKSQENTKIVEFSFTMDEYKGEYDAGKSMIRASMPPTFDDAILEKCQLHRDSIK